MQYLGIFFNKLMFSETFPFEFLPFSLGTLYIVKCTYLLSSLLLRCRLWNQAQNQTFDLWICFQLGNWHLHISSRCSNFFCDCCCYFNVLRVRHLLSTYYRHNSRRNVVQQTSPTMTIRSKNCWTTNNWGWTNLRGAMPEK